MNNKNLFFKKTKKIMIFMIITLIINAGLFSSTNEENVKNLLALENEIQFAICKVNTFRNYHTAIEEVNRIQNLDYDKKITNILNTFSKHLWEHFLYLQAPIPKVTPDFPEANEKFNKKLMLQIYESPMDLKNIATCHKSLNILGTDFENLPTDNKYIRNINTYFSLFYDKVQKKLEKSISDTYTLNKNTLTKEKIQPVFDALKIQDPYIQYKTLQDLGKNDYFKNNQQYLYYLANSAENVGAPVSLSSLYADIITSDSGLFKINITTIQTLMNKIALEHQQKDFTSMAASLSHLDEISKNYNDWILDYFKSVAYIQLNKFEKAEAIIKNQLSKTNENINEYEIKELFKFLAVKTNMPLTISQDFSLNELFFINNGAEKSELPQEIMTFPTDKIISNNKIRRFLHKINIFTPSSQAKDNIVNTVFRITVNNQWLENKYTDVVIDFLVNNGTHHLNLKMNKVSSDDTNTVFESPRMTETYVSTSLKLSRIIIKNPLYPISLNYNYADFDTHKSTKKVEPSSMVNFRK